MNGVTTIDQSSASPLAKFDEGALKGIASQNVTSGAPRASFLPATMGEAMEVAKLMAAGNFVPPHLRGKPGDCLAVVMQAARWGMDPFAVGNKTYFVNDRMAYESQLVNAVVNSANVLEGRLTPKWQGEGNDLVCTVTGKIKGDAEAKVRRVPIKGITTRNSPLWKQDPEQQLAYYATRAWARLFAPEVLMGVYTPDEVAEMPPIDGGEVTSEPLTASMLTDQARSTAEELGDGIPDFDTARGEIVEQAQESSDEAEVAATDGQDDGEGEEPDPRQNFYAGLERDIPACTTLKAVEELDKEWLKHSAAYSDEASLAMDKLIATQRSKIREGNAK